MLNLLFFSTKDVSALSIASPFLFFTCFCIFIPVLAILHSLITLFWSRFITTSMMILFYLEYLLYFFTCSLHHYSHSFHSLHFCHSFPLPSASLVALLRRWSSYAWFRWDAWSTPLMAVTVFLLPDHVWCLLRDHHLCRVGVATGQRGHHASIHHTQPLHSPHSESSNARMMETLHWFSCN